MSLTKVTYAMIDGAAVNVLDYGVSTSNTASANAAALANAIASGQPLFIPAGTYNINTGNFKFTNLVFSDNAVLNFTGNVSVAIQLGAGANIQGKLTVNVSAVTCTTGILISGADVMDHNTAPRCDNISLIGNNHTDSVNGLLLDALTPQTLGGTTSAVQYCKLNRVTVQNFQAGCHLRASQATLTLSYVNANIIRELTLVGCKRSIILDGQSNGEVAANFINDYVTQYGFVLGSEPTGVIELYGKAVGNTLNGFIFDWNPTVNDNPIVYFENSTEGNFVSGSAASWQVQDDGYNNQYKSTLPDLSQQWVGPYNGSFSGLQSNALANFSASGTLTGAASTTGTASVSATGGSVTNVENENARTLDLTYVAGTGEATYTIEFRSTTELIDEITTVGVLFATGYEAKQVRVEMDFTGSSYTLVAEIVPNVSDQIFMRLDTPIPKNGAYGIKFLIKGNDNRVVKIRQLFANGSTLPKTFVSRGGDSINGDLLFQSGQGPVIKDTSNGNTYRIQITGGVLGVSAANPTTKTTYY